MHLELEVFISSHHFIQYNGEPLVHCFYTLPLRDHAIVKVLLNLKKHALQDDTKFLVLSWILFNIFCGKKQNKCFFLFLLG